jgi:hypothetical protein
VLADRKLIATGGCNTSADAAATARWLAPKRPLDAAPAGVTRR